MVYDFAAILLFFGCLVGIAVIVGRKLPRLKTLNVESIPAERESRLKQRLLAMRLRRRLQAVAQAMRPLFSRLTQGMQRVRQTILELEARHRRPRTAPTPPAPEEIPVLLEAAEKLQEKGDSAAAEDQLMQVIARDPHHVGAYEQLGALYLASREYAKVREVYAYLLKVLRKHPPAGTDVKARAAAYQVNIATTYLELGRKAQALQAARKAASLEPNNPRVLDFLLKISILVKDKALAETTWQALQMTDPENAKLNELRGQIDELS